MTDYDVIAELKAALAASTEPDPAAVAHEFAATVPSRVRAQALAQALARLAPVMAATMRSTAMGSAPVGRNRWTGIGAIYKQAKLNDRMRVADGWKKLGDCTAEDLRFVAERNREHARATIARAVQYERLADLLDERGVTTVADLNRDDLNGLEAA